jgi:hypothetical protein
MACSNFISIATSDDIVKYDPSAERRAANLGVIWDTYLEEASLILTEDLENGWYVRYCDRLGLPLTKEVDNKIISTFERSSVKSDNITIIRLHVFKTLEIYYSNLVTDLSNVNEVDQRNYEFAKQRFHEEFQRALNVNNFYDSNLDGLIEKSETVPSELTSYFNKNRRQR